jgi:hypothetical protein
MGEHASLSLRVKGDHDPHLIAHHLAQVFRAFMWYSAMSFGELEEHLQATQRPRAKASPAGRTGFFLDHLFAFATVSLLVLLQAVKQTRSTVIDAFKMDYSPI